MAAEFQILFEAFDADFIVPKDLQEIHNFIILMELLTDSEQVLDAGSNGRETSQIRLTINALVTREA